MKSTLALALVAVTLVVAAQPTVDEIVAKSIKYHDPNGEWGSLNTTLYFAEQRPDAAERYATIQLDNTRSFMRIDRNNEEIYEALSEDCTVIKGDGDKKRGLRLRNYYLYLWGLPMKLLDEGTPFDRTVVEDTVEGIACYIVRVVYEKDTWYFSIDRESGRLVQYKFYQDEEETKGELIKLADEISVGQMRIPQKRSWYTIPENKLLGTDVLTKAE